MGNDDVRTVSAEEDPRILEIKRRVAQRRKTTFEQLLAAGDRKGFEAICTALFEYPPEKRGAILWTILPDEIVKEFTDYASKKSNYCTSSTSLTSDLFIKLSDMMAQYDPDKNNPWNGLTHFVNYCRLIIRSKMLDKLGRAAFMTCLPEDVETIQEEWERYTLDYIRENLSADEFKLIEDHDLNEYTYQEMADMYAQGQNEDAVRYLHKKVIVKLRKLLNACAEM